MDNGLARAFADADLADRFSGLLVFVVDFLAERIKGFVKQDDDDGYYQKIFDGDGAAVSFH